MLARPALLCLAVRRILGPLELRLDRLELVLADVILVPRLTATVGLGGGLVTHPTGGRAGRAVHLPAGSARLAASCGLAISCGGRDGRLILLLAQLWAQMLG